MAVKDAFSAEEWSKVASAPMLAGVAVTAADPSGIVGAVQESFALAGSLAKVKTSGADNALVAAVVAAYEDGAMRGGVRDRLKAAAAGQAPAGTAKVAVGELAAVAALVDAKAPAEAPGFKAWLRAVAGKVAEAGTEGGFLGIGGVKVSGAERATLAEIDGALA